MAGNELQPIGESRTDLIAAYRRRITDAVNEDPNWDMRYYDMPNSTSDEIKIHLMHHTARHHAKIVKNLTKIVNDICGAVDPVQATIDVKGPIATVKLKVADLHESKQQLLAMLVNELVKNFQLAEESVYQDNGLTPPYKIIVQDEGSTVTVVLKRSEALNPIVGRFHSFMREFFDEHIIKPSVSTSRRIGHVVFTFHLPGLREAQENSYDFAEKVARGLMKKFEEDLKRKAASNAAKFEIYRFDEGVPRITATLANRRALTRAAVERTMRDVVEAELPPDNILKLKARFGSMGTASNSDRVSVSIVPA